MRAARARSWCVTTFGLSALLALAEDVLSFEGTVWLVIRGAVSAVFIAALVLWIGYALRERQRGALQSWTLAALMAACVVAVLLLLATLID
jgi:hypothetical protein